jgi:hypothetical protein
MYEEKEQTGGCGCSTEAVTVEFRTEKSEAKKARRKTINIEFLYLDLNVCQPCRGTEANLEEALADVAGVLEKTGVAVNVQKIHVESYEQAIQLGFVSSPTIRVNGRDLQLQVVENHCSSCSELSGKDTNCRVWEYQGQQYQAAPKALIIEAVLREVYGGQGVETVVASAERTNRSLENLKRFFEQPEQTKQANASATSCGCGS